MAEAALYTFERGIKVLRLPPSKRSRDDAHKELQILKRRLEIPDTADLGHDLEKLLLRYCVDTILNILWYERARRRAQRVNAQLTFLMIALMAVLMIVLMAVALALICASAFTTLEGPAGPGATVLPLALLAGGALTVLQVIAGLGDGKAKLSIFWKASADLKEALYNFEHKWHGRVVEGSPPCVAKEFEAAVGEELRLAHAVTRSERLEFFAALRSPSDVLAVAVGAMNSLRAQRAEDNAAVAAHDEHVASAKRTAYEARAAVLASEYRLQNLADPAEKQTEGAALVKARAEVVRAEAILQELSGR
jgi:hypothetical protein